MTITYVLGENLYVNVTNQCPNACDFCIRNTNDAAGDAQSLWLEREPTVQEILDDIFRHDLYQFRELVFCGFGEPMCRAYDLLAVCRAVRQRNPINIRINTNGLSDLIHGEKLIPRFKGLIDTVSVSLNACTAEEYDRRCHSQFGAAAFDAVLEFTRQAVFYITHVVMTVVDVAPAEEISRCRRICEGLGADFRVRELIP